MRCQQRLPFAHGAALLEIALPRVIDQIMIPHLDVVDVLHIQTSHAFPNVDHHCRLPEALAVCDGLVQLHGKVLVTDRLHHKIQRLHLIALNGILREVRHKDKAYARVHLANLTGCLHAVHQRHFDIHEDHVVIGGIIADEVQPIAEFLAANDDIPIPLIAIDILPELVPTLCLILHDCNTIHIFSSVWRFQ